MQQSNEKSSPEDEAEILYHNQTVTLFSNHQLQQLSKVFYSISNKSLYIQYRQSMLTSYLQDSLEVDNKIIFITYITNEKKHEIYNSYLLSNTRKLKPVDFFIERKP